jgi:hypothetical protein
MTTENSDFQTVFLITGEHAQSSITCRHTKPGNLTLSNLINYNIYEGQKNYITYTVLSRQNSDRKDADEAITVTILEQYNESSPLMKIKKLMMIKNSYYYYCVEAYAKASEYDSYSSTFDKIINSFLLDSEATPLEVKEQSPANGFTGMRYINSEYGFSFQYPTTWVEKTTDLPISIVREFGVGAWFNMPCVWFIVVDQSTGDTLQDAFVAWQTSASYTPKTFTATDITIDGIVCTKADITYTNANGDCNGTIVGFTRNSKWIIIGVVALPSIGGDWEYATQKADIIGTLNLSESYQPAPYTTFPTVKTSKEQ